MTILRATTKGAGALNQGVTSGPIRMVRWVVRPAAQVAEEVEAPDQAAAAAARRPHRQQSQSCSFRIWIKSHVLERLTAMKVPNGGFAVNNIWAFADGGTEVYSLTSSVPPIGFETDSAITAIGPYWPGGGTTILFADALSPHPGNFVYYDDVSKKNIEAPGPFSALEWAILTYAHEITHQNGMGTTAADELKAEGYAYNVLKDYREDGGKKCL